MKYLIYILLFLLGFSCVPRITSPSSSIIDKEKVDISIAATCMSIDDLGFLYFGTQNNSIVKYDINGTRLFENSLITSGSIEKIDAHNPHKILVFYNDFQVVKFLDNTLSEISSVSLDVISSEISQVAMSNDNSLWVYDVVSMQLKKINDFGNIIFESDPISDMVDGIFNPVFIKEDNNKVYLYDSQYGLFVFDFSAHFLKRYPILNKLNIDVNGDQFSYTVEDQLNVNLLNDASNEPIYMTLDGLMPIAVTIYNEKWIVLTNYGVVLKTME